MAENNTMIIEETPIPQKTKVAAVLSMVFGIVSICMFWGLFSGVPFGITGIILSSKAKKKGYSRFVKAGKITSIIGVILGVLAFLGLIVLRAIIEQFINETFIF